MFITFFLLRDGPRWWQVILARFPEDRRRPAASIVGDSADVLSGYMVGTGAISLFAGVTAWLMMVLLGLPLALPVGVLTFFLSFIPYIGDAIATILAFLIAVAVGPTSDVIVMGVYTLVINIVQGNIVAPLVYKRTVSLPAAIVLLSVPAGAAVGGMMGMFLVVPFLGVIAATWRSGEMSASRPPDRGSVRSLPAATLRDARGMPIRITGARRAVGERSVPGR
ncbi:MAG: AI-2E family transporter [Chloroflexi bacterium]|nr:AI-2E family transporter [Chloroflexota bacterium]